MQEDNTAQHLYLDLMKKVLTRVQFPEKYRPLNPRRRSWARLLYAIGQPLLDVGRLRLVREIDVDPSSREEGLEYPPDAETMIGMRRLDNVQECVTQVLKENIPGDLIETGVWRGGACIFMRAILKAYGDTKRTVWAADSFKGLPKPNAEEYPEDAGDQHWTFSRLAISVDEVKANFERYGLLDEQVQFLVGFFKDTLPDAPMEKLAVLRLDGDMYESTMDALRNLYPKLSKGGFCIIDDYQGLENCRKAVLDYRDEHGITEEITPVDTQAVFWRRSH
jgi:O-methyltransferase